MQVQQPHRRWTIHRAPAFSAPLSLSSNIFNRFSFLCNESCKLLREGGVEIHANAATRCALQSTEQRQPNTSGVSEPQSYRAKYPLPPQVITQKHEFTDIRGRSWVYESDSLPAASKTPPSHIVLCLHVPSALGTNRTYWDRLFETVASAPSAQNIEFKRFEWIGTGNSYPKPSHVSEPYELEYFLSQLNHYISTLTIPPSTKLVLLTQGTAEPFGLRTALTNDKVSGLAISTGLTKKSITTKRNDKRSKLIYAFLSSFVGYWFYKFVARRSYIEGFVKKNLLTNERHLQRFVDSSYDGLDERIRFNIFSFFCGFHFDDYRPDYVRLYEENRVRVAYFAGLARKSSTPTNRSLDAKIKSTRPPLPIAVTEESFKDSTLGRMQVRQELIPNLKGVVVDSAGFNMFYEETELSLPHLIEFVNEV